MTAADVVRLGPTKSTFPTEYICDQLTFRERKTFRECFNLDLYNDLLQDQIHYNADPYSLSKTYQKDDIVSYNALYYISLKDDNKFDPTVITHWKIAPKFNDPCFSEIWCDLSIFLAYRIILPALRYATYQAGGKGIVIHMTDETHEKTANSRAFEQYLRQVESDGKAMLEDLKYHMEYSECSDKFYIFDSCGGKDAPCIKGLNRIWMI